jgi:septal ring factor EnvC (AmiA/AmiB activator)
MRRRLAPALLPFVCFLSCASALAADESLADRYARALKELEANRAQENETRAERDRLAGEAQNLQARLVANANKVQELEAAHAATQQELAVLRGRERVLLAEFDRDRQRIANLLAVLQRLYSDRPPALVLRPDDSLAAARGTMQLGATLPPIYEQIAALDRNLKQLSATQEALQSRANQAQREAAQLTTVRAELDRLLQLRNSETAVADIRLKEIEAVTASVARESEGLKTLIDRIAALRAGASGANRGMTVVNAQNSGGATLERGSLRVPVIGTAVPGDPAGPGRTPGVNIPQGLWFSASGSAQAVAPGDSEVVFAGSYQNLGLVLILEMLGGYHLTLAGLGRIDVQIGDLVLAGEPVGVLPSGSAARLYMELRRNGQTVDLAPWMSAELRKANGT